MTHDPWCPISTTPCVPDPDGVHRIILAEPYRMCDACLRECHCETAAKVRADEGAKYVLPDLPRGGEHVDWCRDLACYGCEEIADGVIAQSL